MTQLDHKPEPIAGAAGLSNLPSMAYRCRNDASRTMLSIGDASLQITGYAPGDLLLNKTIAYGSLIHPDDRARAQDALNAALAREAPFQVVYRIITRGGEERLLWELGRGITPPAGEVEEIEGFISDVTGILHVFEALRDSEQRCRTLVENMNEGLVFQDDKGAIVFANEPLCEMLGLPPADVLGRPVASFLDAENRAILDAEMKKRRAGKRSTYELTWTGRQRRVPTLVSGQPMFDSAGLYKGSIGVVTDITERKEHEEAIRRAHDELEQRVVERTAELSRANDLLMQQIEERRRAEQAFRESEQRLNAILDNTLAVVYVKDFDGRYILVNRRYERLVGITREEIVGKTDHDVFSKEAADQFRANDIKVIQTGAPQEMEEIVPHPDGLHIYISIKFLLYDPKGRPYAVCGISTDITERKRAEKELRRTRDELEIRVAQRTAELSKANDLLKEQIAGLARAEEALRRSEQRLNDVIDNSPAVIYIADLRGRLILVNRQGEKLAKLNADEMIGRTLYDIFPKEAAEAIRRNDLQTLEAGTPMQFEETVPLPGGTRTFLAVKFPLRDAAGKPYAVCGITADITERKRADQELHQERDFIAAVLNTIGALVIVLDADGRVVRFNRSCEQTTGYTFDEVKGKLLWDLMLAPEEMQQVREVFRQLLAGHFPSQHQNYWVARDGTRRFISWSNTGLRDDNGKVQFVIATGFDITQRKRAEEALRFSEEKYRNFFDNAQVGFVRNRTSDGKVIDANHRFAEMFGYASREEMIAECTLAEHYADPGVRDRMVQQVRKTGEVRNYEARLTRKDGSTFWVRLSARLSSEGDYLEGIAVDVTDEHRAVESLRESEERFRELFEYAHDLIFTIDSATGRVTSINNAARDVLSYQPGELIDKPFTSFINPDYLSSVAGFLAQAAAGTPTSVEAWCRRKDGTPVLLDFRMRSMGPGAGPTVHVIAYDVTERRRESEAARRLSVVLQQRVREETASLAEANHRLRQVQVQLIQSEKLAALGQLAAGVSHEINNPLSFVSNNLVVLRRDFQTILDVYKLYRRTIAEHDPAQQIALAEEARTKADKANIDYIAGNLDRVFNRTIQGTERIRKIVRDMLDFARLGEAEWKEANVNQALDTTISIITHDIKTKNIDLVRDFKPLPTIYCMPGRLNQVFLNILLNAVQAVPEGGKIIVSTWPYQDGVKVAISDNGMGIPRENMGKIFDPFFTTKPRGTGLGLSISYTIVAEHGGQIEVESEVGKGSTFTIILPLRKAESQA